MPSSAVEREIDGAGFQAGRRVVSTENDNALLVGVLNQGAAGVESFRVHGDSRDRGVVIAAATAGQVVLADACGASPVLRFRSKVAGLPGGQMDLLARLLRRGRQAARDGVPASKSTASRLQRKLTEVATGSCSPTVRTDERVVVFEAGPVPMVAIWREDDNAATRRPASNAPIGLPSFFGRVAAPPELRIWLTARAHPPPPPKKKESDPDRESPPLPIVEAHLQNNGPEQVVVATKWLLVLDADRSGTPYRHSIDLPGLPGAPYREAIPLATLKGEARPELTVAAGFEKPPMRVALPRAAVAQLTASASGKLALAVTLSTGEELCSEYIDNPLAEWRLNGTK